MLVGAIFVVIGILGIKYGVAALISGVTAIGLGLGFKKGS